MINTCSTNEGKKFPLADSHYDVVFVIRSLVLNFQRVEIITFHLISENRGDNQGGGYQQNWSKYTFLFMSKLVTVCLST